MNIVQPYAKILKIHGRDASPEAGTEALRWVEWCARISHASEDAQTEESWRRFIDFVVMQKGDWSVTEHVNVSVEFLVDRGISHEWVRHRLFAFTQSSTRFINYAKKMPASFVEPPGLTDDAATAGNGEKVELSSREQWRHAVSTTESVYRRLLESGCAPQIARSVFPNALSTKIITTGNLRNWRHALMMRSTKETHPQMRQVILPLLDQFKSLIPILYNDIEPNLMQNEAIRRAR